MLLQSDITFTIGNIYHTNHILSWKFNPNIDYGLMLKYEQHRALSPINL